MWVDLGRLCAVAVSGLILVLGVLVSWLSMCRRMLMLCCGRDGGCCRLGMVTIRGWLVIGRLWLCLVIGLMWLVLCGVGGVVCPFCFGGTVKALWYGEDISFVCVRVCSDVGCCS